jgi:hypothetical protein
MTEAAEKQRIDEAMVRLHHLRVCSPFDRQQACFRLVVALTVEEMPTHPLLQSELTEAALS